MRKSLLLLCLMGGIATGRVSGQNQSVANGAATAPVSFTGNGCTYTWVNNQPSIGLPASGAGNIAAFTAINPSGSPVVATITATPVPMVFAYIPNYDDKTVSVVNTVSNQVVATIPVGTLPESVSVTPDGSTVYIGNIASNDVSVINTATNTVTATIPLGVEAYGVVVNHAGTTVYVGTSAGIKSIDIATNTVTGTFSVPGSPIGVAIAPTDEYVYAGNFAAPGVVTQVDVVDHVTTFAVGVGSNPFTLAISPDGSRLYVVNNDGYSVTVIDVATKSAIATIPVGAKPRGSAVSPDGKTLYVTNLLDGTISIINTATNTVTATIPCGASPGGINVSADGKLLYVAASNSLVTISAATNAILSTTPVGNNPIANGNFLTPPTKCGSAPVTFTITVNPTPNLTASAVAGYISTCVGTASASPAVQQFMVTGTGVTADVTATAPTGFEVSLSLTGGFGNSVTLTPSGGAINNEVVYVRSAATAPAGDISGNVVLTEGGITEQTIAVKGVIHALPTLDQPSNQTVLNGAPTAAVNFTGTGNTFTWVNNMPGIGLAASGSGNISSFEAINTGTTPIVATITVTNKNVGFAYAGETGSNKVAVINTFTHAVVDSILVGGFPYGMWQTPDGKLLYVANGTSNTLSVINTATQTVTATIPAPGGPFGIVGSADGSTLYVADAGSDAVSVINTATQGVVATIYVGVSPSAISMSPDGKTIYVANTFDNTISVISTVTNTVTATIAVGQGPTSFCQSPDGTKLYVTDDLDNNLEVISTATNTVVGAIPVGKEPHNLAISADGSTIYTANQVDNTISVVNTASGLVTATIPVGSYPDGLALTADGSLLYVTISNASDVDIINTATNQVISTIPVGPQLGSFGNFVTNDGCPSPPMTFTITVNPTAPAIVATGMLSPMTTVYGTPSPAGTFTISGSYLTAGMLVTPPTGFEVSADGTTFSSTVTVGTTAVVAPTTLYIRLAAITPAGSYTGNIVISSTGAISQDLAVPASTVSPAPLTITVEDTSRPYGQANPVFTFVYSGFQNNETEAQLTTLPQGLTTATELSPVGDYPIMPGGAEDPNYTFTYVPGKLTVTLANVYVSIPNAFTPNGDGKNDTWGIRNLAAFVNCKVLVFGRYGQTVFASTGYSTPWNGTQNGSDVPAGTYVYIIDLGNGTKPMRGTVIVIR